MSTTKKRSSFQITSVTSDSPGQSAPTMVLNLLQSEADPSSRHRSSSQPSTPTLKKKAVPHDAPGLGVGSRFKVVRLAVGGTSSKRYRRGRWTCTDVLERPEGAGIRRIMESMRHAHSLESLEMIGPDKERGWVHSQDTSHLLAQPIRGRVPGGPCSPTGLEQQPPKQRQNSDPASPPSRPNKKRPPLRLDLDADGRSVLRFSHSQPSSPPIGLSQPTLTPAALSLDQDLFKLPEDDSFSSNSLIAIDNKIEQAMDLVKSHLLLAVREEVELLKDQIRDLQEKNQQLERENHILRALTHNISH